MTAGVNVLLFAMLVVPLYIFYYYFFGRKNLKYIGDTIGLSIVSTIITDLSIVGAVNFFTLIRTVTW